MKKTIFIAVALSLLLCATVFTAQAMTPVHGQKVAVTFEIFNYPTGQTTNTRIFIRNLDPEKWIFVWRVILVAPDGSDVFFNYGTEDEYYDIVDHMGGPFLLAPYASTSFSITFEMLATSSWPVPTVHEGGRPFLAIWWYAEGGSDLAVPAEIWGFHRSLYDPGAGTIRYSFDRWEGRVMEEYPPEGKKKIK